MSRISAVLGALRKEGRSALVPFITVGDPNLDATVPALNALVCGGADLVELGIPFSDPEADGPAIQAASERALAAGATLSAVLECVGEFRRGNDHTPVILMGYLNCILAMGQDEFVARAAAVGVDGLIMVNLPPEDAVSLRQALDRVGIDLVLLAAPTTSDERLRLISQTARGFIYLVALKGITGADHINVESVGREVGRLRQCVELPILVGFGIKDGATAKAVARYADGVVIGAALVSRMGALCDAPRDIPDALLNILQDIRRALDA